VKTVIIESINITINRTFMMRYPAENSGQIWGDYEVAHDYNTTIPVIIVMKKKKEIVTGEGESRTQHRRRARGVADSRSFCQLFCKKGGHRSKLQLDIQQSRLQAGQHMPRVNRKLRQNLYALPLFPPLLSKQK
jgi:hypothetical protein